MKKVLLVLAVALLLVSAVQAASTKPQLEKITFVHYAKDYKGKPTWDDTVTDYRLISGGVRWTTTPVTYYISTVNMPSLDPSFVLSTITSSSETWDDATGTELFYTPTFTNNPVVSGDGVNTVGWGNLQPGVIAVTQLWYNPATKEIVEFDMILNTYYAWGDATTATDEVMDLQNIATHEFGHAGGLGDLKPPKDSELTMYAYSDHNEVKKRTLGVGDILGIQKLYGG
jgi:hypothetical protein